MAASTEEEFTVLGDSDEDYYTFLNVGRQATNDEISNAYRRLSRLYHPDKHFDPVKKRQAENLFGKTKKAYEVLSDPHSRAIYDSLGTKGLEAEGWEVVQRTRTPQEIRDEYERLAREKEERKLQQRTNPKGSIHVNINATDLFDSYEDAELRSFPELEVSGMSISQSIEAPLTLSDTLTLGGQLQTHNGTGTGTVNCSWRRVLSAKSWTEVDIGAGNGPLCSLRFFRTLSRRSFANMAGIFQLTPQGIRPGLQAVIGRQLDKHTMGYLTWKAGMQSSMNTMVVWDTSSNHLAFSLQFGIPNSYAMMSYTHKFLEDGKVRGSIKAGTFGAVLEYGCEKRVSQHSILGATMTLGIPLGVTLKIKDADKQKEANASKIAEKRREAESAVALMQETYQRTYNMEEGKRGLLIVKALYGKLSGDSGSQSMDEAVEVTIPLQCLVKDSKLTLHESSKSQLPGFYDPCVGEEKSLYVQYKFHGLLHETSVADNETLRIPKQSHRIDS